MLRCGRGVKDLIKSGSGVFQAQNSSQISCESKHPKDQLIYPPEGTNISPTMALLSR